MDCIFCKIANGGIPADIIYEDEEILCFHDLNPQAPVHVLIIPREHIASLDDLKDTDAHRGLLGHIMVKIKDISALLGLDEGYRVVNNCGEYGQQTVGHIHFHLLGGRRMTWPPG